MQELLKYQNIDGQLRKLKAKLLSSENRNKAGQMQQYLKDIQNKILNLDESASSVIENIDSLKKEYNIIVDKIEKFLKTNTESLEDVESIGEEVSRLSEKLSKIEKTLFNLQNKLLTVNKEFENLMKNAKMAKTNLNYYKAEYSKQKTQVEPEIEKLTNELNSQKKKVNPEMLAKYNSKLEAKIFPIFVPLSNNRCEGCRMDIPASKIKDLQSKHYVECENCGRIIYQL